MLRLQIASQDSIFDQGGGTGDLLNANERKSLLYDHRDQLRSAQSVIGLLSRRTDYVQQNVRSASSLLQAAEQRLAEATDLSKHDQSSGKDFPLTEVVEEIDDDGNLVSGRTSHPAQNTNDMVETLKKAISATSTPIESITDSKLTTAVSAPDSQCSGDEAQDGEMETSDSPQSESVSRKRKRPRTKKRVSFAEGTKAEHDPSEHPIKLPKDEQVRYLQDACSQLRQQLGENTAARRMGSISGFVPNMLTSDATDISVASQLLRLQQNRQAKRLLKAYDIDLQGAATVLSKMAAIGDYDMDSPRLANVIADARDARSNASSSRESSPGSFQGSPVCIHLKGVSQSQLDGHADGQLALSAYSPVSAEQMEINAPSPALNDKANRKMPEDDTPEEAALRRQMLQYNMNEVGSVVAELDIDEQADENGGLSDDDVYMDSDDEDDEDDDEDDHGRTVNQVLSGDYIAEMRALEQRLKARAMVNAGPGTATEAAVNGVTHNHLDGKSLEKSNQSRTVKGVRFAEDIDVQEIPESPHMIDVPIVERQQPRNNTLPTEATTRTISQSRAARTESAPSNTSPPTKRSLGSRPIVERQSNPDSLGVSEPDKMEATFHQNQVKDEYHRLRNRIISNQGGFRRPQEPDMVHLDEAEASGSGRKMSRFKAAKLGLE